MFNESVVTTLPCVCTCVCVETVDNIKRADDCHISLDEKLPLPLCYAITSELFTHRDLLLESRSTKGQRAMMGVEMERVRKVGYPSAHKVLLCCVF